MKKKFFAVALAATMAFSTVMTANAATADVDITGGLGSANTGDEAVTGNFDVTYTFKNASHDASANWNNFAVEVFGEGFGITSRADAFAVGYNGAETVLGGWGDNPCAPTTTWIGLPEDWAAWAAGMADASVKVNVKRSGNVLTLTYNINAGGTDYTFVGTTPEVAGMPDTLNVHLTGEKVNITNITFTDNTKEESTEKDTTEKDTEATTEETTTTKDTEATTEETTTAKDTEATNTDASKEIAASVSGDNVPAGATITANKVEDKAVLEKVAKTVKEKLDKVIGKYAVLDITMSANGTKVQPLNNGNVLVTIDVPSGVDAAKDLVVYRMEDNGDMTELKTMVKNGKISFETSHFSTYIVAEKAVAAAEEATTKKADSPKTGDAAPIAALMVVALGACGAVVLSKRKNA